RRTVVLPIVDTQGYNQRTCKIQGRGNRGSRVRVVRTRLDNDGKVVWVRVVGIGNTQVVKLDGHGCILGCYQRQRVLTVNDRNVVLIGNLDMQVEPGAGPGSVVPPHRHRKGSPDGWYSAR